MAQEKRGEQTNRVFRFVWKNGHEQQRLVVEDVMISSIENHYYYYCYYCFTALCPRLPGWADTRRNLHPVTYPDYHPTFISFFHLLWSIASSLFNLRAWQSFCTTSVQVLFGLPLGLEPSTSYSIHFFTQPVSLFATHAHTIATCFAVVPRLYHLFLVCQLFTWDFIFISAVRDWMSAILLHMVWLWP